MRNIHLQTKKTGDSRESSTATKVKGGLSLPPPKGMAPPKGMKPLPVPSHPSTTSSVPTSTNKTDPFGDFSSSFGSRYAYRCINYQLLILFFIIFINVFLKSQHAHATY